MHGCACMQSLALTLSVSLSMAPWRERVSECACARVCVRPTPHTHTRTHTRTTRTPNRWQDNGHFKPDENAPGEPFVISMPPPNVTGRLHMGHAMTATVEDIMVRPDQGFAKPTLLQDSYNKALLIWR
jgi:hypothetical protein